MLTVAETIRSLTAEHLINNNGLLYGQCVRAVGWVGGTIPELTEEEGIVELPTSDVAGPGFVVGAALFGRRPIFVCRYQGFMWYNAATIVNYAAKSNAIWNVPCPLFVRSIAMEGGIGPVASNSHHSMMLRMPGIKVVAPITSYEYTSVWSSFLDDIHPYYCSEHRRSFKFAGECEDRYLGSSITLVGVSASRFDIIEAANILKNHGIDVNIINIIWLKPLQISDIQWSVLSDSLCTFVVDTDYCLGGAAEHIAYNIMIKTKKPVYAMGLKDITAGFAKHLDNLPPSPLEIVDTVMKTVD